MAETDPASQEAYNHKFAKHQTVSGSGFSTATHFPCPFCAEPDWKIATIMEVEQVLSQNTVCQGCGRTARYVYQPVPAGGTLMTLVQTGASSPPVWMLFKPRRETA